MSMAKKTNNKHRQKNLKIAAIVAGIALCVVAGLKYQSWKKDRDSKTAAVAQEQKKTQDDTSKSSTSSGGVVDNNASASTSTTKPGATPPPTASAPITLATPADGALVVNGTVLSGSATVTTVQYRFKDVDGLDVATGALSVAGGKYSGSVAGLNARTTTGTLEVYNYNANGAEENWVKINVRYK